MSIHQRRLGRHDKVGRCHRLRWNDGVRGDDRLGWNDGVRDDDYVRSLCHLMLIDDLLHRRLPRRRLKVSSARGPSTRSKATDEGDADPTEKCEHPPLEFAAAGDVGGGVGS